MPDLRTEKGFTLIEVLVALAVTALMLTAVYQTVSSATMARKRLTVENGNHHVARMISNRVGQELQSLHYRDNDPAGSFSGGFGGGDLELLSLASTASTPLAGEPGLPTRIRYLLVLETDSDQTEYRLDRIEASSLSRGEGRAYKLADNLSNIEIGFYGNGTWTSRWNSQTEGGLPVAVSLAFSVGRGESKQDFRTIWQVGND